MSSVVICKRGHVTSGGLCLECKRMRDREYARKNPKPELTEEQKEEERKYSRERYAAKMRDPKWAKKRSTYQSNRDKEKRRTDKAYAEKQKARKKKQWEELKSDKDRLAKLNANRAPYLRCYRARIKAKAKEQRRFIAARLLAIATRAANEEKIGIIRKA